MPADALTPSARRRCAFREGAIYGFVALHKGGAGFSTPAM
jgi:hypothetical protein